MWAGEMVCGSHFLTRNAKVQGQTEMDPGRNNSQLVEKSPVTDLSPSHLHSGLGAVCLLSGFHQNPPSSSQFSTRQAERSLHLRLPTLSSNLPVVSCRQLTKGDLRGPGNLPSHYLSLSPFSTSSLQPVASALPLHARHSPISGPM